MDTHTDASGKQSDTPETMKNHTPGPWRWMRGAEAGWRLHAGPVDGKKTLVMRCGNRGATLKDVPSDSDARLIERAPELLAERDALKHDIDRLMQINTQTLAERDEAVALLRDCAQRMERAREIITCGLNKEWAMLDPVEARAFLDDM
jgi:hypothetical protein